MTLLSTRRVIQPLQARARRKAAFTLFAVGAATWSGCQSLEVTNPNTPNVDTIFGSGQNLEAALVGSWRAFWGVAQGGRTNRTYPVTQLSAMGNELTSADAAVLVVSQEPRVAIDNRDAGGWTNRKPWYDLYESIASARDALQAINTGLKVGTVDATTPNGADTPRARVFAKFLMGVSTVYLGLLFDQAYLHDENTNPATYTYELKPHPQVRANGVRLLREAIAEAKAAPNFSIPSTYINGQTIGRDDFIRVMYSYITRAEVYSARNPTERAAVLWTAVLARLDSGITKNFSQQADLAIETTESAYWQYSYLQTNGRTNNRLIGPADTSGEYQRWLGRSLADRAQITIVTPDRRIHGAAGPTTAGTYFAYLPNQTMSTANGTYMHSRYRNIRYLLPPANNWHLVGLITTMSVDEMKFIRAEALFRLGPLPEAVALINPTRVAAGLKAVTIDGPPAGRDCVPRKDDGTCGNLFDAIQYEKRIELFPTEAIISFVDARGWGKLLPGTPIHFPVHGRELELMGFPYYTFGGGGVGSAP